MARSPLPLAGLPPELTNAPAWRREPYLLLFPLGALLAWAGVLPWLFFALGATSLYLPMFEAIGYRAAFHPIAQVEGFLTCFAVGFLFTFIPRRTGTRPPAWWQMAIALAAPVAAVGFAWFEWWLAAQAAWLVLLATLVGFAARRTAMRRRPIPPSFVWVVMGLSMGTAGAILAGLGMALDSLAFWVHLVGRGLLLQGLFTGLVLGIGGLLLPAVTRGVDVTAEHPRSTWAYALHAVLALAFAATFFVEHLVSVQVAYALRAAITLAVVIGSLEALQPPTLPGLHRRVARWSVWMLPAGYLWVTVAPEYRRAGLHLVFLGCFTVLVLAVSTQVSLSHRERPEPLRRAPWQLVVSCALVAAALIARVLLEVDPPHFHLWLGASAAAFLTATVPWAALTLRRRESG
jgi:uncharacterized protein involved in response to NO